MVLVLSALGRLRAMATFPLIFGGVVAAVGIIELVRRRRTASRAQRLLLVGAIAAALAAPTAQSVYLGIERGRAERAALARLAGSSAPALRAEFALGGVEAVDEPRHGRLTVVNFWATWCPPCVEELPMLEAWARRHDPSAVRVIGFTRLYREHVDEASERRELDEVERFLRQRGVSYLNLVERGRGTHDAYGVPSMPTTVLVGRDGEVLELGIGRAGAERILAGAERLLGP